MFCWVVALLQKEKMAKKKKAKKSDDQPLRMVVGLVDSCEHAVVSSDVLRYCGYDKSDQWEKQAATLLGKGGSVTILQVNDPNESDIEEIENQLHDYMHGKPCNLAFKVLGKYDDADDFDKNWY